MALPNTLQVRVPAEVRETLQKQATASGHTLSGLVRHILWQFAKDSARKEAQP